MGGKLKAAIDGGILAQSKREALRKLDAVTAVIKTHGILIGNTRTLEEFYKVAEQLSNALEIANNDEEVIE